MSFVVETGSGLSDANSYLAVADADTYHADHGDSSAWSGSTQATKEESLRLATQYLDVRYNGRWKGVKGLSTQALAWPRSSVVDADGYSIDTDIVPRGIEGACAELALRVVDGDTLLDDIDEPGTIKGEKVKVGPIEDATEYMGGKSQVKKYPKVDGLVRQLICAGNTVERA